MVITHHKIINIIIILTYRYKYYLQVISSVINDIHIFQYKQFTGTDPLNAIFGNNMNDTHIIGVYSAYEKTQVNQFNLA